MNQNTRPLNALISRDLYAKLHSKAHELEVSKAHIVRVALKAYLNSMTPAQMTQDIIKDVEELTFEE